MSNIKAIFSFLLLTQPALLILPTSALDENKLTEYSVVDQLRYDFLVLENELWNYVLDVADNGVKEESKPEMEVIRKFGDFGSKINKLSPRGYETALAPLENVWAFAVVKADLVSVEAMYATFRRFQDLQLAPGKVPSPRAAWRQMAEAILTEPHNRVDESLVRIEGIVANGVYRTVAQELDTLKCDTNQSAQQVLYNLYNSIALTELKGYTMIQFSYMLLKLYNEGNFTKEAQQQQERFESRSNAAIRAIKAAMEGLSRDLYRCDPRKHVKGKTYEEVTQLLQGYVQNEVDMNNEGTCRENCAEYKYTKSYGCYKNLYCRQQRNCAGKILNCKYYDSDMWICPASPLSGRRYEYIKYESGEVLGRETACFRGQTKVDSWWRWLFWHCSYCMCLCDEAGPNSDRFFNLRPVESNMTHNMVVTGLRFVKVNRVFHLQVQEGLLEPFGKIDETTLRWVPVDGYKITDRNVHNGQDYHQLSWEQRALDLDDLQGDQGQLVTGVKFKKIGSHLNFEIRLTPFDFKNGTLVDPVNKSIWKDNPNTDSSLKNPRLHGPIKPVHLTRLNLYQPDIPTRTTSPSVPDSSTDQYVEFVNSDFKKDAAQTTVPFIDIQPVQSLIAAPLSGAGIFHKGQPHFGGFVAPKLITYDFREHLKAIFPEEGDVEGVGSVEMN
ncbi:unnamed protein product [Brassicogethes aeneus]|uniref:Uncharacterized protein n=1 Tax=Brassicogethes aeneus TaxID=1431903 RepID=A0A9P0BFD8_BRAAE|nr:unnamed protein product [Brassicogethes aeneus]